MKKNDSGFSLVFRMMKEARPIYPYLALACVINVLAVSAAITAPKLLGSIVDAMCEYTGGELMAPLVKMLFILLAVYAIYALLTYVNMMMMNRVVSRHYTCALRIRISDKLRRLPVKYFDKTPVGDILARMTDDVSTLGNYIHQIIDTLTRGFIEIIAISVMMFREDWILALIVSAVAPISILLSSRLAARSESAFHAMFTESGKLTAHVEESFSNFATTKAFNLEENTEIRHTEQNSRVRSAASKATFMAGTVTPLISFSNSLAYILICLVGGWLIVKGSVSIGAVVTVVLYSRQFSSPLERIASAFGSLNNVKACVRRVFKILDTEEEPANELRLPSDIRGEIEFRNVCFSYTPERDLIRDLSFRVLPGQSVAIVGPTGAGKTTIVNLLMRFYDVDSGKILLDGYDITSSSRDDVRHMFGMVLQDTWLFKGTIAENVSFGTPGASREDVIEACKKAYCDSFIRTLPNGYDTVISDDTVNLSGGQKQLLTIARAILADRSLLILDEATSNVDTRTELLIQRAMDRLMENKTSFIIAHRLSTIVDSDLILVIRDGKIVEQGTHRELLKKNGFYSEIYRSQYKTA